MRVPRSVSRTIRLIPAVLALAAGLAGRGVAVPGPAPADAAVPDRDAARAWIVEAPAAALPGLAVELHELGSASPRAPGAAGTAASPRAAIVWPPQARSAGEAGAACVAGRDPRIACGLLSAPHTAPPVSLS